MITDWLSTRPRIRGPRRGGTYVSILALYLMVVGFWSPQKAASQEDFTRVYGPEDGGVPTPFIRVQLAQQDTGALQQLIDYVKAVNLPSWQGLHGTGSLANLLAASPSANPATLILSAADKSRLDVTSAAGTQTTRINATSGGTRDTNGRLWGMPQATARLGLVFFPQLLSASFPTSQTALLDGGQVQIQGQAFHKITVGESIVDDQRPDVVPGRVCVIDLYFDPTSGLLMKSAAQVQVSSEDRSRYVEVVTYSDYRSVGTSMIPFKIHQSLNGQPQWTLQLTSVELSPDNTDSDFYF